MIVYVDQYLAGNFIVDYFLLLITMKSLKVKLNIKRLICASLIGTMYSLVMIIPKLKIFTFIIFKFGAAFIMILIIFYKKSLKFILKSFLVFMMFSILLGGLYLFLQLNTGSQTGFSCIIYYTNKFFVAAILVYIVCERIFNFILDRNRINKFTYTLEIFLNNKNKKINAFLDTGNELREPITNLPVIVVEKNVFSDVDLSSYESYLIPYKVVGDSGIIKGFRPKTVVIYGNGIKEEKDAVIGLVDSHFDADKGYNALLSREILL